MLLVCQLRSCEGGWRKLANENLSKLTFEFRAMTTYSFNGKPKATATARRKHSRLRLAVKHPMSIPEIPWLRVDFVGY